jgi:DnaD/phage-associated family protein
MNFILQLNAFYAWLQANSLSPMAKLLYYTLLQINNSCCWISWFQRTNTSLCGLIGISENTLKAARNELKVKGLIDFKSGNRKNDPTKYHIIELYNSKLVSNNDTKADTNTDTQVDTNTDTKADDINKLKEKELVVVVESAGEDYDLGLKKIQEVFSNNIHLITTLEYQKMQDWLTVMEADAIVFAIEESVLQGKRTMSYIEGILKSFEKSGVKTRSEAEAIKRDWMDKKNQSNKSNASSKGKEVVGKNNVRTFSNFKNRSYDGDALEEILLNKTKSENTLSDEDFEKFMAERQDKQDSSTSQQRGNSNEVN